MKNITCIISSLQCGGAERVMTILAGGLADRGYNVTLLTISKEKDFYTCPENVKRAYALDDANISCKWFDLKSQNKRLSALRESITSTNPDIVISFIDITNILVLKALEKTDIPVLASEHISPVINKLGWRWEILRLHWYPKAESVVMLTQDALEWAKKRWLFSKFYCIPNPVLQPKFSNKFLRPEWFGEKNVIAVGRLHAQKGYDFLIKAFEKIANEFKEWNLIILGEGNERKNIENLIQKAGLIRRVFLPGNINPPFDVIKEADIYVMSSRFEGFPMALCEAMACGLPVISFDCPSGPREIIRHGVDGLLVPPQDSDALAEAIRELIESESKREYFSKNAKEIVNRYSLKNYLDRWEDLLKKSFE